MNTITPLMRAIMEALDHDAEGFCHGDVACLVGVNFHYEADEFDAALYAVRSLGLVEEVIVSSPSGSLIGRIFKLTDAGCAALWALQKADAVALVSPQHQAAAMRQLNARPVSFNTRAEMRAFLAGAKA